MSALSVQDYDFIRTLLKQRSAISLDDDKGYLVESRLTPLVRELNLESISQLVQRIKDQPWNGLPTRIVEAMVTTETSFFRDHNPYEGLRKTVLPDLIQKKANERRLVIWSAACSTGQEPYSIAMLIREYFPELLTWNVSILATDISKQMINRAREGCYNQIEANRGLPATLIVKYFERQGLNWKLNDKIRSMVEFREMNLAEPWPAVPMYDLILLRNVMIYFEVETKRQILDRAYRNLQPHGYLLLGGAETPFNIHDGYRRVEELRAGFYQLIS